MVLNRRLFVVVILMLALAVPAARAAENVEYVRLHVVAASDTARDQAVKLQVRDAVLACARALLEGCDSAEAAWRTLLAHLDELARAARERLEALGRREDAACRAGVFAFPVRDYGGTRVPAGDYRAIRVVIGAGEGRNWWCVLYPDLCYAGEAGETPRFYSVVWDWLRRLFGGDGA